MSGVLDRGHDHSMTIYKNPDVLVAPDGCTKYLRSYVERRPYETESDPELGIDFADLDDPSAGHVSRSSPYASIRR